MHNYKITIRINDNNAVINDNHGRLQDLILLFRIPICTRKDFCDIDKKFWNAVAKRFSIPDLGGDGRVM